MKPFNVEIFDQEFALVAHTNIDTVQINEDYLAPEANTITMLSDAEIKPNQYIRLVRDDFDLFGIITEIADGMDDKNLMDVSFMPFSSLLNVQILFDTTLQGGSVPLETVLQNYVAAYLIENDDTAQNVPGLSISSESTTNDWTFEILPDEEYDEETGFGGVYAVLNLYYDLFVPAFLKYDVKFDIEINPQAKTIVATIGKEPGQQFIEADLPNIFDKTIITKSTQQTVNKLVIYNTQDYTESIIYYLHADYSYDTTDADRITPVVYEIATTAPTEGDGTPEDPGTTFAEEAQIVADGMFANIEFENLIELCMMNDDEMIQPASMRIGQTVTVLSNGTEYNSVLTGRQTGETTKLIFGFIRLELTKQIKRRERNGRRN